MSRKERWWWFTNYKLDFDYEEMMKRDDAPQWIGYGNEICPSTKRPHHQGYMYFASQRSSMKKTAQILGKCKVGMCDGTPDQNDVYCKKEGRGFKEWGERPAQGKRADLTEMKDRVANGESVDNIVMEDPLAYHQYGRTLNRIEDIALRKRKRDFMTEGEWIWGPTGTGKSKRAFEEFSPETHYVVPNDNGWWDGYTGQETVIIDDFRGDITYHELLTLVDRYPKTVKRRNREPAPFLARKLIITSALPPEEVYRNLSVRDGLEQLKRRFKIFGSEVVEGNTGPRPLSQN